jgi:hypothetical protein
LPACPWRTMTISASLQSKSLRAIYGTDEGMTPVNQGS